MKIVLLTDIPPCTNYTAGLVLDQLCKFLPRGSIACLAIVNPQLGNFHISPDLEWLPITFIPKPREMGVRTLPGGLRSLATFSLETYTSSTKVKKLATRVAEFCRKLGTDRLWCVLQGQTMIRLARPVSSDLSIPLYTQLWDPPHWWLRVNRIDKLSSASILSEFQRAVRSSHGCAAASWAMAEKYANDYGVRAVALVPGLDARLALPPAKEMHPGKEFIIALAGQLYATEEWNALVSALNTVNWKICGRDVKIRLLGRHASLDANAPMRIEFLGWQSQPETIRALSEADVLYCPYWFDPTFEVEARQSFPSKLTTYLAAGRPVLFHGPDYASPARFLKENDAGLCCHSLEAPALIDALSRFALDSELYCNLTQNGRIAFERYLTLRSMREAFAEFLQVEENWLSSISSA